MKADDIGWYAYILTIIISWTILIVLILNAPVEARPRITELKAGYRNAMAIQTPTYVQDDSLKPADVSVADVLQQSGSTSITPGTQSDLLSSTFTVPPGQQWRISVRVVSDFSFFDNANLAPFFAASLDIVRDGAIKSQGVRILNFTKVAAANNWQDMSTVNAAWSELLGPGTYTISARIECSAISSVLVSVSNTYLEILKFKA